MDSSFFQRRSSSRGLRANNHIDEEILADLQQQVDRVKCQLNSAKNEQNGILAEIEETQSKINRTREMYSHVIESNNHVLHLLDVMLADFLDDDDGITVSLPLATS